MTTPRWLRAYLAGEEALETLVHGARGVWDGLWLGLLDDDRLAQLDRAHYDGEDTYVDDAHNRSGLWAWEQHLVDTHLPPGGRIAVTGAGGGREVVALLEQGFEAVGYEPNARLAAAGADLVARLGHPGRLRACGPRGWPGGDERFDAVLLGWGAYMLVPSRRERIDLLRDASAATGGRGAVLLSYFEMPARTTQFKVAARVARPLRRLRRAAPSVVGDALVPNYAHHFTRKQVREELAAAGLDLIAQGSAGYGWSVGRAPRAPGDAPTAPGAAGGPDDRHHEDHDQQHDQRRGDDHG